MPAGIEIKNFSKSFGSVRAVDNISLTVTPGELFGLIGPDGAGKTTTMRTLCTLLDKDSGELRIDGLDIDLNVSHIRSVLGYMPQRFSLYPDLTVEQNLTFFADLFGVGKAEKALQLPQLYQFSKLGPFKKRLASALSGGMKQKLALSCTLVHTPRFLILDEPTTGVDPVSRREFWNILQRLRSDGVTIMVSTPYMDEASLCDRVAFMFRGQILASDTPDRLGSYFPHHLYEVTGNDIRALSTYFSAHENALSVQIFGDRLHLSFSESLSDDRIENIMRQAPGGCENMMRVSPSTEDVFLHLMKSAQ